MARKATTKPKTANASCSRKQSPEPGDGDFQPRYNSRTGRPIRHGAGRKSADPSYLDTTAVVDDDGLESESGSEDEEGVKKKHPKRKRTPSPPLPGIDALPLFPNDVPSREPTPPAIQEQDGQSISLTINIPKGFFGPIMLTIDRNLLNGQQPQPPSKRKRLASTETATSLVSIGSTINVRPRKGDLFQDGAPSFKGRADSTKKTFADLPAEIRNQIYRLLFVTKEKINFGHPVNFQRSSAMLQVCRQIYNEGRKERRFVRDEHVIYCLRQLSRHGKLKELEISFYGRKCLVRTDYRFLDAMRQIKVDELVLESSERHWYSSKVDHTVKTSLRECMVRSPKLYKQE
ncbi:hypothetical protein MPH_13640 [Macrophomina phaseolina MS6]|uniref:Uncharacterized protein n=1 Tax=Macrophomina phaseolina (strain MS6) TaxID=1126212 RepID=K2QHQ4_MACPH|nr:hypothetical protein MPH_13640 [Macrophomina phaseolina MS6]